MDRHPSSEGEALGRRHRLRRRSEFQRCYRLGRKRHGSLASLHFLPSSESDLRLGVTATRKVGNAVARHRVKRRVREIFRRWPGRSGLAAADVVVHLKPEAAAASFAELAGELSGLLATLPPRAAR